MAFFAGLSDVSGCLVVLGIFSLGGCEDHIFLSPCAFPPPFDFCMPWTHLNTCPRGREHTTLNSRLLFPLTPWHQPSSLQISFFPIAPLFSFFIPWVWSSSSPFFLVGTLFPFKAPVFSVPPGSLYFLHETSLVFCLHFETLPRYSPGPLSFLFPSEGCGFCLRLRFKWQLPGFPPAFLGPLITRVCEKVLGYMGPPCLWDLLFLSAIFPQ